MDMIDHALSLSPVHQVLIEKSVRGYKEIEYEVIRDGNDTAIAVCNMENLDPVGIHTGDSIVVCPSQTLTNKEYQMLRDSALKVIRALEIEGGCNVQFALDPRSFQYYLIEVNPRVSRSSALASKASGYPIARVSAKISIGMRLDEIMLANTPACFEPSLDYVVTKLPRFPFDKFTEASNELGTQMKATGEVMSVGRCFEESLLKGIRSLEIGLTHICHHRFDEWTGPALEDYIKDGRDDRIYAIARLFRLMADGKSGSAFLCDFAENTDQGQVLNQIAYSAQREPETENFVKHIYDLSGIDPFFLRKILSIVRMEYALKQYAGRMKAFKESSEPDKEPAGRDKAFKPDSEGMKLMKKAKELGFSDKAIGSFLGLEEEEVRRLRKEAGILPVYKMIDSCASEFDSYIPYFYSCYEEENESLVSDREKIIVLGSGPIRIGQGVEFDYSTVHAVKTIKASGYEAIIINNNPETVSTDYTCSDKLYFEPLCIEDVMNVIELEHPVGVIATLGGQTAINLAEDLKAYGVHLIGTECQAIRRAENRDSFEKLLEELDIPQPAGRAVTSIEEGLLAAEEIGYPVLVRPSYVLGGRAMQIVAKPGDLTHYLETAVAVNEDQPVLVDHYIRGKEVEVDAICDGGQVFVPGIMELVERTGVHSGDSMSIYPARSISDSVKETILDYTRRLGLGIGIIGLYNIQFIVDQDDQVYIIEVNPRSSRTVPFLSKATGYPLADMATLAMLGVSLKEQGINSLTAKEKNRYYVKAPAFSFSKLYGMDAYLSPEMKSTGEAIGYDRKLHRAMYKAMIASGIRLSNYGTVVVTLADEDKEEALPLVKQFYDMGFNIEATIGTAIFLKEHGIRTRIRRKLSEGSEEILDSIRAGYVSYVINTRAILSGIHYEDGVAIRRCATQNNITMLTSLDTVRVLLEVLREMTIGISTIDGD